MFGISTSVFNEAGGLVKDWLKNPLNASFFYWYFLPAVGFVLLQLFVIGPVLGYQAPKVFNVNVGPSKTAVDLILQMLSASFFALLLLPLIIAVIVSSVSGTILRLYQGKLPIARALFRPWLKRNQKRSSELYGPLPSLRRQYFFLVSKGVRLITTEAGEQAEPVADPERAQLIDQLKQDIQALHERLEATTTTRELPVDLERVGPTDLANTLSLAEEYPFERYGMDPAVFWPRLSAEIEPEKLESMTASFGAMNGLLNLSLLSCLFATESLIVAIGKGTGWIRPGAASLLQVRWLFVAAAVGIFVALAAYRAALGTARSVGNAMRTAFDYYRGNVLRRFNLKLPDSIEEERVLWLKLAAFIRRGESFYYPSEFRGGGKQ
jgi:hypothetical protein